MTRRVGWILLAAGLAALCVIYFCIDPMQCRWMPHCPLKMLTGLDCPGCGSQRAIHSLLHGDIRSALEANWLLIVLIPYLTAAFAAEILPGRLRRLRRIINHPAFVWPLISLIILWGLLRNLI